MSAPAKEALTLQHLCQTIRFTSWPAREIHGLSTLDQAALQ
jgi:hypothetical protein